MLATVQISDSDFVLPNTLKESHITLNVLVLDLSLAPGKERSRQGKVQGNGTDKKLRNNELIKRATTTTTTKIMLL